MNKDAIASLQKQIKAKQQELADGRESCNNDPEIKKLREIYIKANEAYNNAISKFVNAHQKERDNIYKEISVLENKIEELRIFKILKFSKETQEFIRSLHAGCNWGPKGFIPKWVSPSGRFIIATNPGHNYWSGRGESSYAQSTHYLLDISKYDASKPNHGSVLLNSCKIFSVEGRLNKETIKRFQDYAMGRISEEELRGISND